HEPRAMANLAPPLLAGYLTHIASLQGDEPRKQIDARVLAGVGIATLGVLLFVNSLGTANRAVTAYSPMQFTATGVPARLPLQRARIAPARAAHARVVHARNVRVHRALALPSLSRARPVAKHIHARKRFSIAARPHPRHHHKRYAGIAALSGKTLQRGHRVAATQHFLRRAQHVRRDRMPRTGRLATSNVGAARPPVFRGIFKPFRWVLFKPVHRGPG
nr:hypothetical protein [Candidatus Eremiobacteraeota bacterium]